VRRAANKHERVWLSTDILKKHPKCLEVIDVCRYVKDFACAANIYEVEHCDT